MKKPAALFSLSHPPTNTTKLFVLLGSPLGHSLSPPMHNLAFERLAMDCLYLPVEVSAKDLGAVFTELLKTNVYGFNITTPHKIAIKEYIDQIDPLASTIGAVNTILVKKDTTIGYNTDGEGFIQSLEREAGIEAAGKRFCVLGCGGAARAIAMTLAAKDAEKILLHNRSQEKAVNLSVEINQKICSCARAVDKDPRAVADAIEQSDILINTTSVGMFPQTKATPVDPALLRPGLVVADIVYNPQETALLTSARARGCRTLEGLGMLLYQGVEAFKIWTGKTPPVMAMRQILEKELAKRRSD